MAKPSSSESGPAVLDIIFVHGLCGSGPDSWSRASQPLSTISRLAPQNANVLEFDCGMRLEEQMSWETYLRKSSDLLQFLVKRHDERRIPIFFICQTFGGILLKETLWRVRQQPHRFYDFLNSLSGIIFLGTPHIIRSNDTTMRAYSQILKADLKAVTKRTISKRDLSCLAFAGMRFDELGLRVPIMSGYETRETKIRGFVFLPRRATLAPKEFVMINVKNETIIEIDIDINRIFDGGDDALIHRHMSDFLSRATLETLHRLQQLVEPVRVAGVPAHPRKPSVTSSMKLESPGKSETPRSSQFSQSPAGSHRTEQSYEFIRSTTRRTLYSETSFPIYLLNGHSPNANFHGRHDVLSLLDEKLLPTTTSFPRQEEAPLKTFWICGVGGIGKTQVAAEFVYTRKAQFDAIFMVNADETEKIAIAFCQIAERLGLLEEASSKDHDISKQLVMKWFANPKKALANQSDENDPFTQSSEHATWLLVFDNADDPHFLEKFWPSGGKGSVLVTSRDPKIRANLFIGAGAAGVDLKSFTPDEAVGLLKRLAQRESDQASEQTLREIVEHLDYFPFAINSMAGVIWQRSLTLEEFLDLYSKEDALAKLHNTTFRPHHDGSHTLSSTWALEKLPVGAYAVLKVASLLDPDGIQQEILRQRPEGALELGIPQDKESYFKHLGDLTQSSLLTRNTDTKELVVHRIVQTVVRARIMSEPGQLEATFDSALRLVSAVWPFVTVAHQPGYATYANIDRWKECERIYPHVMRLKHVFENYKLVETALTTFGEFSLILSELAWYQVERARPESCISFANLAFTVCENVNEDFRDILAALHGTRQHLAFETNDPEGCLYHAQEALNTMLELSAERQERTSKLATATSEMGKACSRNGLYHKALEYYAESRRIREAQPGFHKVNLFTSLLGRGHALWLLGQYQEASQSITEALDNQAEFFGGPDDTSSHRTGLALFALGNVRLSQGLYNESISLHQRAMRQYRATIGEHHHQFGDACYKVGEDHVRFQEYDIARLLFEKALTVYRDEPYYLPEIARTNYQLGKVLSILNDTPAASKHTGRATELIHRLVPDDPRPIEDLQDGDFDRLICFWAR